MDSIAEQKDIYQSIKAEKFSMALLQTVQGTYTPGTGTEPTSQIVTYPSFAIITNYSIYEMSNSLIKQGDKKVLLAATPDMPEPNGDDTLVDGTGMQWAVGFCKVIAPMGVPLLYIVNAHKLGIAPPIVLSMPNILMTPSITVPTVTGN